MTERILTDEDVAGRYSSRMAATSGKALYAVVAIDQYGGHRHYFEVFIDGKETETESLAAAMRQYNKGGKA